MKEQLKKYYTMQIDKESKTADITIFGDITSWPWLESDVSSYKLSKRLEELKDVENIIVHINSYGGEVAEGWAIYNSLVNHSAKVTTIAEGFACSIASVIFMAGEERIVNNVSALMIHNVLSFASGNANELRKTADDLEKLNNLSKKAYLKYINISDEELQKLMDAETFLTPEECLEMGFATSIKNEVVSKPAQSARKSIMKKIFLNEANSTSDVQEESEGGEDEMKKYKCEECGYIHEGELPEYFVCPECGASKDSFVEVSDEEEPPGEEGSEEEEPTTEDTANQKAYHFFNAIANERGEE